ncbi:MAG: lipid A biosynthesis acyltransferase [Acidobacteria bacterium]|nr:MAG: lipid A biosynthesis acyltransferase [Acidobacteriota bacterium]
MDRLAHCGALIIQKNRSNFLYAARLKLEYYAAMALLKAIGAVPRKCALLLTKVIAWLAYLFSKKLRKIAEKNLSIALPELEELEKRQIVRGVFLNLGRLLGEFSQLPRLHRENISQVVVYDGFENFAASVQRGKGTLFLTAHFGAWELCPYAHAIYGHPLKFIIRPIDNPQIDSLVNNYRTLSGNEIIEKKNSLKEILKALKSNQAIGILIDQNTTLDTGVFARFFNIPACTTTSLATIALRTNATVVPGVLIWDGKLRKHRLHFEPPVELIQTGDLQADIVENTALFNQILEKLVRKYPDQWLWVHRRWKTRPPAEKELY